MTPNEVKLATELAAALETMEEAGKAYAKVADEANMTNFDMLGVLVHAFSTYGHTQLVSLAALYAMEKTLAARAESISVDDMIAGLNLDS